MSEHTDLIQQYAVEVSGWDQKENFFGESTRLEWNEQNLKKIVLRHCVKTGGMVFLRLLDPVKAPSRIPVAYRASRVQPVARGCSEVEWDQVWPERTDTSCRIADLDGVRGTSEARPTSGTTSRPASRIESMFHDSTASSRRQTS